MIEQMEARARLQLAGLVNTRAQARITEMHHDKAVTVQARLLKSGKQILGYSYDGIRLERSTLLQLLCTETDCPHCQQTQTNWKTFRGIAAPVPRRVPHSYQFRHLVEDVEIKVAGRTCVARPASFQCRITCPAKAHPPAVVKKTGWDLFAGRTYIAGGLVTNPDTLAQQPALPTIAAATAWFASAPHELN